MASKTVICTEDRGPLNLFDIMY